MNLLASCSQWVSPPSAPETRGPHWFWAPSSGSARKSQPASPEGCPRHHQPLPTQTQDWHYSWNTQYTCICCVCLSIQCSAELRPRMWMTAHLLLWKQQCVSIKTSQILDEVLKFHLAFQLDVGAVHVSVEEDDGESQDEDGVRVSELTHHIRVTDAVTLAKQRHTTGPCNSDQSC